MTVGAVAAQVITAAVAAPRGRRPAAALDYPERVRPSASPLAIAGLGGVAFGVIDDLRGSGKRRGLRGHLGALAHGEVTTGTVKLAGLAATGLGAALLEGGDARGRRRQRRADRRRREPAQPLRPPPRPRHQGRDARRRADRRRERAGQGAARPRPRRRAGTGRLAGLQAVAAPAGAALALLPEDLGERAMLGDAGANALGAMLGAAAARALPRSARLGLLTGIVALTVASEKVSFTRVIEATPPLRWLDMLGRRPVPLSAPVAAGHRLGRRPASALPRPAPSGRRTARLAPSRPATGAGRQPGGYRRAGRHASSWTERLGLVAIRRRRPGRAPDGRKAAPRAARPREAGTRHLPGPGRRDRDRPAATRDRGRRAGACPPAPAQGRGRG